MNIPLFCILHQDVEGFSVNERVVVPDHMLVFDLPQNGHLFEQTPGVSIPHGSQGDFLEHEELVWDQVALALEDRSKGAPAQFFNQLVV